jgi:tRNA (guanine37-N1)-methyltransferase
MLAIKAPLNEAEKIKKILIKNCLLDFNYKFSKETDYIFFPVLEKTKNFKDLSNYQFIDKALKQKEKSLGFKELLQKFLSNEELYLVKTAFDSVGDIAILEIDEALRSKEKKIAKALLDSNVQIKTVLRKAGSHEGTFRTQKMKYLAGENKKVTFHKENNVTLKLNVEEVYFSVRLSTERKRIAEQVKEGEDILVMFCGAAPYPCTLSKNTNARYIYGIELNPNGHAFGQNNVRINGLNNVFLINGDVKDIVPKFYSNIIGMKSANIEKEINPKLKLKPNIFEFHLFDEDLLDKKKYAKLCKKIEQMQKNDIKVWVHQQLNLENPVDLARYGASHQLYKALLNLVDKYDVNLTIHPSIDAPDEYTVDDMIKNALTMKKYFNNIYFENGFKMGFNTKEKFMKFIEKTKCPNFCIDLSHLLANYQGKEYLDTIKTVQSKCNTYFHVNDYNGKSDSAILNKKSNIDLENVLPLITKGIVEINDKDYVKSPDMIYSWNFLNTFQKKFDRILMPLPKSAEDFLDSALIASKKGTIIHFYDFLHEEKFHEAHQKIEKACKKHKLKYKILDTVKCGQHSPRTYRICVDFKILS